VVIKIEVVHPRFKAVSVRAQERWIKNSIAGVIDGAILLGLLVSLSLIAHEVDVCAGTCRIYLSASITPAVILGFLVFGLLLLSVPDFGIPSLLAVALAIEKPVDGTLKIATSVVFGEPENEGDVTDEQGDHRLA